MSAPKVIFVIGGPGAGKGTQCSLLSEKFNFRHYSAGDLLRSAATEDSEKGRMIDRIMKAGEIVPSHITIGLLKDAIDSVPGGTFLIDGFPRSVAQGEEFESMIVDCEFVLYLDADLGVMEERLLKRVGEAKSSGQDVRADDNAETIKKRFNSHAQTCLAVVEHYEAKGKVCKVNANQPQQAVTAEIEEIFRSKGLI